MKLNRLVIKASDYRKSFAFYHDILGLRLKNSWQRPESWGALFYCGDIMLEIIWVPAGEESLDCNFLPERSKTDIFFEVDNVDAQYQRLSQHKDLKISQPEDMPWGYRVFSVYDPDHVKVVLAQPI